MLGRPMWHSAVGPICAFAVACASPTLPLPPPDAPTLERGTDVDHVKLVVGCGGAEPNAIIVVFNTNPNVSGDLAVSGARASGCGAWDVLAYAHPGDVLDITQVFGDVRSLPVTVLVR
jgi:hypothetical protein